MGAHADAQDAVHDAWGGVGGEEPAGDDEETRLTAMTRGGKAAAKKMEERSACRPLLHHRSGAYGATWSTRAGFCPVPSREL